MIPFLFLVTSVLPRYSLISSVLSRARYSSVLLSVILFGGTSGSPDEDSRRLEGPLDDPRVVGSPPDITDDSDDDSSERIEWHTRSLAWLTDPLWSQQAPIHPVDQKNTSPRRNYAAEFLRTAWDEDGYDAYLGATRAQTSNRTYAVTKSKSVDGKGCMIHAKSIVYTSPLHLP